MKGYPKPKLYIPKNPEKYAGDVNNIVMRSSWEKKFATWCDFNPSVIHWGSESFPIDYWSVADNKQRRYFVDFIIKMKSIDGSIKTLLIEIKPYVQTIPPKKTRSKSEETYLNECYTYQVNQDKWTAAREFAQKNNATFVILDEFSLGIKKQNK